MPAWNREKLDAASERSARTPSPREKAGGRRHGPPASDSERAGPGPGRSRETWPTRVPGTAAGRRTWHRGPAGAWRGPPARRPRPAGLRRTSAECWRVHVRARACSGLPARAPRARAHACQGARAVSYARAEVSHGNAARARARAHQHTIATEKSARRLHRLLPPSPAAAPSGSLGIQHSSMHDDSQYPVIGNNGQARAARPAHLPPGRT